MKILVACEYSGIVRDAFIRKGHDAVSCDILDTESPGPHVMGDVKEILYSENWDMIIAHPPCTRLTLAGVRWLHERNLWEDLDEACEFFKMFLDHPCEKVAIENPIPHGHATKRIGSTYDQKIQPWQFGHTETKAICLWLKGLPKLEETDNVYEEMMGLSKSERNRVHHMAPSKDRAKMRSRFFEGVAEAMAEQWG